MSEQTKDERIAELAQHLQDNGDDEDGLRSLLPASRRRLIARVDETARQAALDICGSMAAHMKAYTEPEVS